MHWAALNPEEEAVPELRVQKVHEAAEIGVSMAHTDHESERMERKTWKERQRVGRERRG